MSFEPTRVLLVDDHPLFRAGVRTLLSAIPGIEVIGEAGSGEQALELLREQLADEAGSGEQALELLREQLADVVLLDIGLPGMSGVTTAQRIKQAHPKTHVVVLSMYKDEEYVAGALKAGATGYVLKDATQDELRMAIDAVRRRQVFISPAVSHMLVGPFVQSTDEPEPLTSRQKQVLTLLARGLTAKQVAAQLDLSTKTVETHRAMLMERLGIRNLPGLVLYAIRNGLIDVD
jgi:DNA-binding NarL/FixJ family response regulator